ncbi:MAG TPA: iron ABC transporter permease [Burkholderiaceae bacterium]|jgi:iron complex transport system permease protein|nr:iron ABC transporter permease [Burkholderiaceae bacterium]
MRDAARPVPWIAACFALALLSVAAGLAAGSAGFGFPSADIVWQVRLPRVLCGLGAGAAFALAGALMQLLTRNPLADPSVLGLSGGASVGALAALAFGSASLASVTLGAALGAGVAAAVLFMLSWRLLERDTALHGVSDSPNSLLLVGVMLGTACAAMVSALLALAPDAPFRGMVFWLLGDLNGASSWLSACAGAFAALAIVWPRARELDLIARGEAWAESLGVPVRRRRRQAVLAASLAVGCAVATAGGVGFVGLVVPQALRLAGVRDARLLLPASALLGGGFIVLADTLARTVAAPVQLPVGVVSASVGVPAFLWLLLKGRAR